MFEHSQNARAKPVVFPDFDGTQRTIKNVGAGTGVHGLQGGHAGLRIWTLITGICLGLLLAGPGFANPRGGVVVHGSVSVPGLPPNTLPTTNIPQLSIRNTPNTIIDWQSFGISANEVTRFIQQGPSSAVLNRVVGQDLSTLAGRLESNGRVFLINPNGIIVSQNGVIDTAGFIASTLDMTNEDFIAGKLSFKGDGTEGAIINRGYVRVSDDGDVLLVAPSITNESLIQSEGGNVVLAAGKSVTITSLDDPRVQYEVQAPANAVVNLGDVVTNGGAAAIFAGSIRQSGHINATGFEVGADGQIRLVAKDSVEVAAQATLTADGHDGGDISVISQNGTTSIYGDVSATGSTGRGGHIEILGERVGLAGDVSIQASGNTDGGEVLVGGDFQGGNEVQTAEQTFIGRNVTIEANAGEQGEGGKVIAWADGTTQFHGQINARGGAESGDGGFVEVSGKENLNYQGGVDVTANNGDDGTILLDPQFIVIDDVPGPDDAELTADDVINFIDGGAVTFNLSASALENTIGALILEATDGITVMGLADDELTIIGATSLIFRTGTAGFAMTEANDTIRMNTGQPLTIDATDPGANGTGAVVLGNIASNGGGAITITGTSISHLNPTGNSITSTSGAIDLTATSGSVVVNTVSTSGADITIDATNGITVNNTVTQAGATPNALFLNADSDGNGTGTLNVADGATLVNNGFSVIRMIGGDIDLNTTGTVTGGGQLQLRSTSTNNIGVGPTTCDGVCEMSLSANEFSRISTASGGFIVGDASFSNDIHVGTLAGTDTDAVIGDVVFQNDAIVHLEGVTVFNTASAQGENGVNVDADISTVAGTLALLSNSGNVTVADGVSVTSSGPGAFLNLASPVVLGAGSSGVSFNSDGTIQLTMGLTNAGQTGTTGFAADLDDTSDGNFNAVSGTVDFGGSEAVISAWDMVFGTVAAIQGSNRIQFLARPTVNEIMVGSGPATDMTIDNTELGLLADGFAVGFTFGNGNAGGLITIDNATFTDPAEFIATGAGGTIIVDGNLTGNDNATFFIDGPGATTTLNAGITTAGNSVTISDSVILGTPGLISIDTTNGGVFPGGASVIINGTIDDNAPGTSTLNIHAGTTGAIDLQAAVGATNRPTSLIVVDAVQVDVNDISTTGAIDITAVDIDLNGATYSSTGSTIDFVGEVDPLFAGTTVISAPGGLITGTDFNLASSANTLQLDTNATITAFTVSSGDVLFNGTTTTIDDLSVGVNTLTVGGTGGSIIVNNTFVINSGFNRDIDWDFAGDLVLPVGTHTFNLANLATINFNNTGLPTTARLINNGTIQATGTGQFNFEDGFELVNNGLVDIQDNVDFCDGGFPCNNVGTGSATFTNNGTLRKSGGTGESGIEMIVNNATASGLIEVTAAGGTLALYSGGSGGTNSVYNANGNTLILRGGHTLDGTTTVNGSGTLAFGDGTTLGGAINFSGDLSTVGGGTNQIIGSANLNSITVSAGILDFVDLQSVTGTVLVSSSSTLDVNTSNAGNNISFDTLNLDGGFSSAGVLTGTANITVTNNFLADTGGGGAFDIDLDIPSLTIDGMGTISLAQNGDFDLDTTTLTINGSLTATGSHPNVAIRLYNGGNIVVGSSGTFTIDDDMSIDLLIGGGGIVNNHIILKTGAGIADVQPIITNNAAGLIDAQAGTLQILSAFSNNGTLDASAPGIIQFLGITTDNNGLVMGDGTFDTASTTFTNQAGGRIAPGNSIGTLNWIGNLTFAAGSIFEPEVESGANDLLAATGTVTVNPGAELKALQGAGGPVANNDIFNVITAAAVTSTFDTISPASQVTVSQSLPGGNTLELLATVSAAPAPSPTPAPAPVPDGDNAVPTEQPIPDIQDANVIGDTGGDNFAGGNKDTGKDEDGGSNEDEQTTDTVAGEVTDDDNPERSGDAGDGDDDAVLPQLCTA